MKKCPFRKKTIHTKRKPYEGASTLEDYSIDEDFGECIGEDCMAYYMPYCSNQYIAEDGKCKLMEGNNG